MSGSLQQRVFALDDITIRSDGTGRTVTAYAAVFQSPAEIYDQDGHYQEQIARSAFDKTLKERAGRFGVFYNHARTLHGTPSERGSVPIGTPIEVRADGRGLLTVSRYNKTPLADEVLESIRNGDITGQSFTGRFIKSDPRGPYLPARSGDLTLVTRSEIALVEYGPTPIPAYADAEIVGVRSTGVGNIVVPDAVDLDEAARSYAAAQGWAMPDGSHPIRPLDTHGRLDLQQAIVLVDRGGLPHAVREHVAARAQALGLTDQLPDDWDTRPSARKREAVEIHVHIDQARIDEAVAAEATARTTTSDDAHASTDSTSVTQEDAASAAAGTEDDPQVEPEAAPEPEPQPHSATTDRSTTETRNDMDDRMTVEERAARQSEIRARLSEIDAEYSGATLPDETQTEWDGLQDEYVSHDRAIEAASQRAEQLAALADNPAASERVDNQRAGFRPRQAPNVIVKPDNIYDMASARQQARSVDELPSLYRDRARRAIEASAFPGVSNREDAQERAERLLSTVDSEDGQLAQRMLRTGSPLYNRAFGKMAISLNTNGLTAEESRALALGVDASGGFAVPFQLDPTVILTSDGVINPLRQVARQVQIVGKKWEGVTSAGVTVTRGAEATEAPDSTPTLAQPVVDTSRVQGFIPFSVEIERSWSAMSSEMTMLLQDAKDSEEADSFVNGDGTGNNPHGLIKTLATGSRVAAQTVGGFTIPEDIDSVEEALPPRFRNRASWLAAKSTYNRIKEAASANPSYAGDIWVKLSGGQPPELSSYPAYEVSSMPSVATSGGGSNLVLAFGDFQRGFIIVDRIGMNVELVPHLFGANGRPTGQRGIYAYWSNGCRVLVDNAIRVLNVTSNA